MNRTASGVAGVVGAVVAIGAAELVAALAGPTASPVLAVGDAIVDQTPGAIVRIAIDVFGTANRPALAIAMALVVVGAGALIGVLAARRWWVGLAGFALFALVALVSILGGGPTSLLGAALAPAAGLVAGLVALRMLLVRAAESVVTAEPDAGVEDPRIKRPSRRAFFGAAGAIAAVGVAAGTVGLTVRGTSITPGPTNGLRLADPTRPLPPPPPGTAFDVEGLSPLMTPNDEFFRIDTALVPPRVEASTHVVQVTGMVDEPFEIGMDELVSLSTMEADVTLACVSNEVGGDLVGHARWQGVALATLLERAGVQEGATQIVGRSVDFWTSGFPIEAAFDGRPALVAVGMNGQPLPARHGFPVRLVIGGLYGYVANTKWLSEIEVTTFDDHEAYWIPRGWAVRAPIKVQSRIDVPTPWETIPPGPTNIAGVAWADENGLSGVEVLIDSGPWQEAEVSDELSTTSWRQWRYPWDATTGAHRIRVRAIDADGEPQTRSVQPPAPDGATGHHSIAITVS